MPRLHRRSAHDALKALAGWFTPMVSGVTHVFDTPVIGAHSPRCSFIMRNSFKRLNLEAAAYRPVRKDPVAKTFTIDGFENYANSTYSEIDVKNGHDFLR